MINFEEPLENSLFFSSKPFEYKDCFDLLAKYGDIFLLVIEVADWFIGTIVDFFFLLIFIESFVSIKLEEDDKIQLLLSITDDFLSLSKLMLKFDLLLLLSRRKFSSLFLMALTISSSACDSLSLFLSWISRWISNRLRIQYFNIKVVENKFELNYFWSSYSNVSDCTGAGGHLTLPIRIVLALDCKSTSIDLVCLKVNGFCGDNGGGGGGAGGGASGILLAVDLFVFSFVILLLAGDFLILLLRK